MQQSSNPVIGLVTLAALVAISVLVRRGRLQSRSSTLAPRERIRPLAITLLDPIISVIIIGQFVLHFANSSVVRVIAVALGAALGVVIGYARARIMFVRAIKETKSIVLRRSGLEYGLVLVLIVLRTLEGSIERSHSAIALSAVTGLATLALVEAVARSAFIVRRYLDSPSTTLAGKIDA
jgi:ABC-type maltose transport system permease subunit